MASDAVVTFTARNIGQVLRDGGSQAWRLDPQRARRAEYLVCTQNTHNAAFGAPTVQHGHAFLIGRIAGVVPSPERPDRWLIEISGFIPCDLGNIWAKSGHLRYPVWYTTLEELGIDLATLPPFQPLPTEDRHPGFADAGGRPIAPPPAWTPARPQPPAPPAAAHQQRPSAAPQDATAWARLDAILAQLDRVPDLPTPFDPLEWDPHGLPR